MKALMATMMIALAVCFTGCSDNGGGDVEPEADAPTQEAPEE